MIYTLIAHKKAIGQLQLKYMYKSSFLRCDTYTILTNATKTKWKKIMANTKQTIRRGDLKLNDLKRVIVRIDFTGVIDIDEYVKGLIRRVFNTSKV